MNIKHVKRLTDEELRIKIATILGWSYIKWSDATDTSGCNLCQRLTGLPRKDSPGGPWIFGDNEVPDYPCDLNACHEMEKVLDANQRVNYACELTEPVRDEIYNVIPDDLDYHVCFPAMHATARRRCEAFVLTMERHHCHE